MSSYQTPTMREQRVAVQTLLVSTSFRIFLIILTVVVGILYVIQTTGVSTKGYQISELEHQLGALEHETKKLDVQIAEHSSIQSIETRLAELQMVPADKMVYLSSGAAQVAKR